MEDKLPKIPSELIEPYLIKFLMIQIESVALGLISPEKAKEYLKGVEYFASAFGDIHSSLATSNIYGKFIRLSDKQIKEIAKEIYD